MKFKWIQKYALYEAVMIVRVTFWLQKAVSGFSPWCINSCVDKCVLPYLISSYAHIARKDQGLLLHLLPTTTPTPPFNSMNVWLACYVLISCHWPRKDTNTWWAEYSGTSSHYELTKRIKQRVIILGTVFCKDKLQNGYEKFVILVGTMLRLNTCVQHSMDSTWLMYRHNRPSTYPQENHISILKPFRPFNCPGYGITWSPYWG